MFRTIVVISLVLTSTPAVGQTGRVRDIDDGTRASTSIVDTDVQRRSARDGATGSTSEQQQMRPGQRLTTRVNSRLDTRLTADKLTRARNVLLEQNEGAGASALSSATTFDSGDETAENERDPFGSTEEDAGTSSLECARYAYCELEDPADERPHHD